MGGEGPNNNNFFRISRSCLSSNFDNFPDFAKLFKFELGQLLKLFKVNFRQLLCTKLFKFELEQLLKLFKVNFRQTSELVIPGGVAPPPDPPGFPWADGDAESAYWKKIRAITLAPYFWFSSLFSPEDIRKTEEIQIEIDRFQNKSMTFRFSVNLFSLSISFLEKF